MYETITLAGGCFWCTEAVFQCVDGVLQLQSGYANGQVDEPSYEQVCSGATGHAECVQVQFDPHRIALAEVLAIFFATHDPTTLNQQGHDQGTQYRSAIYWHSEAQEAVVRNYVGNLVAGKVFGEAPIVTELAALHAFWPAEPEHRSYYINHPQQAYCAVVIGPKLDKLRLTLARYLKKDAGAVYL
jgi:peptide-methionine (S)-S-oxide reductase